MSETQTKPSSDLFDKDIIIKPSVSGNYKFRVSSYNIANYTPTVHVIVEERGASYKKK